ncbi:MAG: HDOD domain-containing protein [Chthoniobacteraceae bacterium]
MDAIDDLLKRVQRLPPAPRLLPQLLAALSDLNADISRVVDLITFDPALTAKVLQVCNSAYYAFSMRVSTVADAVNRLGFHGIYTTVAMASSEEFLKAGQHSALDPDAMWHHLVTSAFAAQLVAKRVGIDGNMLFTASLLHDIGKVPLADVLQGDYDALITDVTLFGRPLVALEDASFGLNHADVGARLLENWAFTPEFVEAVRFHHDSTSAGDAAPQAACIELADLLAHSLVAEDKENAFADMDTEPALAVVGLSLDDLTRQRVLLEGKREVIDAICGPLR